jgi:hypothetical protein
MGKFHDTCRERAIADGVLIELARGDGPGSRGSVAFSRRLLERVDDAASMGFILQSGFRNFAEYSGSSAPFDWRFCYVVERADGYRDKIEVKALFEAAPDGGVAATYLELGEPSELARPRGPSALVM